MIDVSFLESKTSNEYDGCTRILFKLQCLHCEKDFWRPKKEIEASKYCNKVCYNEWRQKTGKRIILNCSFCSKEFKKFQHHADKVLSGRYFCSRNCQTQVTIVHRNNCLFCNKEIIGKNRVYCDSKCQHEFEYKENIRRWQAGEITGNNAGEGMCVWLRRFIFQKFESKCCQCGWAEVNPASGKIPLQVEHIDGNYKNNHEQNLKLLCPNCHSLTSTYGSLNKGNGREKRRKKLQAYK